MNDSELKALAKLLRETREGLGISGRELAKRSAITPSNIVRLEQGAIANPRPETLKAIADVLGLDLADVYAAAGYVQPNGLPSFAPYLRSKYADLPAGAKQELERSFKAVAKKYGYEPGGPTPGQDEH
jgi:transcriptional regulator with XRE-family HTH domain